ncbi:hypothetical protein BC828DRAFT_392850 [Blastocladiella britannica]|nr:hypothetical protein BC828DRAFT_392850 [Blastocladiella britannica]
MTDSVRRVRAVLTVMDATKSKVTTTPDPTTTADHPIRDPYSRRDFCRRLATFARGSPAERVMPRSAGLSPAEAAAHGWLWSADDNVEWAMQCELCQARVLVSPLLLTAAQDQEGSSATATRVAAATRALLASEHRPDCPWGTLGPCAARAVAPRVVLPTVARAETRDRAARIAAAIGPDVVFTSLPSNHESLTATTPAAVLLAAANWDLPPPLSVDDDSDVLECDYCARRLGVWQLQQTKERPTFDPVHAHHWYCHYADPAITIARLRTLQMDDPDTASGQQEQQHQRPGRDSIREIRALMARTATYLKKRPREDDNNGNSDGVDRKRRRRLLLLPDNEPEK